MPKSFDKLMGEVKTSVSVKNLSKMVKDAIREMRRAGVLEPKRGYSSEDLKNYFITRDLFLPETQKSLFSHVFPEATFQRWSDIDKS